MSASSNKTLDKFIEGSKIVFILKNNQLEYGKEYTVEKVYCEGRLCKLEEDECNAWWRGAFSGAFDETHREGSDGGNEG